MGIIGTLINSAVSVVAGLIGFGMLIGGAQQAAYSNQTVGTIVALLGVILLVFAAKL